MSQVCPGWWIVHSGRENIGKIGVPSNGFGKCASFVCKCVHCVIDKCCYQSFNAFAYIVTIWFSVSAVLIAIEIDQS